MNLSLLKKSALFCLLLALSSSVMAHTNVGLTYSFSDGFLHPWMGIDHLLVMLAVGFWGSVLVTIPVWLLPMCFVLAMAAGALFHFAGFELTGAEQWVAMSLFIVGLLLWTNGKISSGWASAVVSIIAFCHGYVHAADIGPQSDQVAYASGFLSATVILLCFGTATRWLKTNQFKNLRISFGILTTVTGLALLTGY
jgi:urease accessory protein